jgi:ubiquinone/menaquinone biosynthesis C-methylase UbiE
VGRTVERRRADVEEVSTPVREWMLRELRPQEGDTVLELAAGVGETGFEAAKIVGETGRLNTSDFSPAMLEAARRRGTELGVTNVDYRVIDAERIELDDDSVGGVLCRFGYMLMPDPAAALAETRRHRGGRGQLQLLERRRLHAVGEDDRRRARHGAPEPARGGGRRALREARRSLRSLCP